MSNIAVIGIGAMGGGMARALLESPVSKSVVGYDRSDVLVNAFYQQAFVAGKAAPSTNSPLSSMPPTSLEMAVTDETDFVILVLQTEAQCQAVCFGDITGTTESSSTLLQCVRPQACVILCSTVTPYWAKQAALKFSEHNIVFVDCPISGGPIRARQGELTLLSSCGIDGNDDVVGLEQAKPILDALGRSGEIYHIVGGAGQGSMAKMVHQLLACVHMCVTAESLALAAKAGLNVQQMYKIVNGAAGASWMFTDRAKRMIDDYDEIKSQLQIVVKDLDIIYQEAKRLQAPIPLATAALQQFICAQSLGLSQEDDSQVVKVYENVTKVPVRLSKKEELTVTEKGESTAFKEGDQVGELWKMENGVVEEIVEVGSEPRHTVVLSNDFVRAIFVSIPPKDTTLAHRHAQDSLYFFLVEGGLNTVNHIQGSEPFCDCLNFGEVRFGNHIEKPLVHKVSNISDVQMFVVDAELLKPPPVTTILPLMAEKHELIKTREKCRVYKLTLEPGESVTVTYPFFHLSVILQASTIDKEIAGPIQWTESVAVGDVAWKEPVVMIKKSNIGQTTFVEFIAEWR